MSRLRQTFGAELIDSVGRGVALNPDVLEQTRTGLETEVLVSGERSPFDLLRDSSRQADLTIMGIAAR